LKFSERQAAKILKNVPASMARIPPKNSCLAESYSKLGEQDQLKTAFRNAKSNQIIWKTLPECSCVMMRAVC